MELEDLQLEDKFRVKLQCKAPWNHEVPMPHNQTWESETRTIFQVR